MMWYRVQNAETGEELRTRFETLLGALSYAEDVEFCDVEICDDNDGLVLAVLSGGELVGGTPETIALCEEWGYAIADERG